MFAKRPTFKENDQDLLLEQEKMLKEGRLKVNSPIANKIEEDNVKKAENVKNVEGPCHPIRNNARKQKKMSIYAQQKLKEKSQLLEFAKTKLFLPSSSNSFAKPGQLDASNLQKTKQEIMPETEKPQSTSMLITGKGLMLDESEEEGKRVEKELKEISDSNLQFLNKMSEEEILKKQKELLSNPGLSINSSFITVYISIDFSSIPDLSMITFQCYKNKDLII